MTTSCCVVDWEESFSHGWRSALLRPSKMAADCWYEIAIDGSACVQTRPSPLSIAVMRSLSVQDQRAGSMGAFSEADVLDMDATM